MFITDAVILKTSMKIISSLEIVLVTIDLNGIYNEYLGNHTFYFISSIEAFNFMRELEDKLEDKRAKTKTKDISHVLRNRRVRIEIEGNRLVAIGHGEDDVWVKLLW